VVTGTEPLPPTIVADLGGLSHLSWVVTAYTLATTASRPAVGQAR
jgi:MFS family permease